MIGKLTLLFLILWPMAGGVASFIAGRRDKRLRDYVAGAVTVAELAVALCCCGLLGTELSLPGVCGLGLRFKLGGFRLIYAVLIAYMWAATTLFSPEYLEGHHNRNRYYLFVLLTLGAIMGVFLSDDLYTTFVFFEMMSLFSLIMVIQDETPAAIRAAQTYLAIAIIGGLATLSGLILLHAQLGTLEISALADVAARVASADRGRLYFAGGLIFTGFAAKAAIFPAHIWLPTAHTAAPAPSSALLSGLLTKSGLFGVLVLSAGPFLHDPNWGLMLLILALITMVLGAVLALFSVNIKRTLACSSMSQLGFILTGIAMQCFLGEHNDLAVRGVLLYMVGHSLIKLVLFLAAGVVHRNTHRLELNDIRGFGRGKPLFLFAFLMGGLGLMGMPLWNGYLGKTLIHESIVGHLHHLGPLHSMTGLFRFTEWAFLLSGGMTAAYVTKLFVVLFVSRPAPSLHEKEPYISSLSAAILGLSALILPLLGLLPYHLADPLAFLAAPFMRGPEEHHAVGYFLRESLEGAGISLGVGAAIYVLFVRPVLMRRDGEGGLLCLDLWPRGLDLEQKIFRPLFLKVLPVLGGDLARTVDQASSSLLRAFPELGRALAWAVDRASSCLLSVLPFLGAVGAHLLDLIIAGPISFVLSRAAQVRFIRVPEDKDFGLYREETPSIQMLLPSSLAYSLMAFALGLLALMAFLLLPGPALGEPSGGVLLVPLKGTVGVQMEEFVGETLEKAGEEGRDLVVIQLDTPGGLVEAMRGIVQAILASRVPVAVWVPPGGRAASAGAFLVQAAHVAAMAQGTNIGAAHPVEAGGGDIEKGEMSRKVMNDLQAQMRSVVQLRGRNQEAAERMIEESLSLTAQEALEEGVIDLIADDVPSLLAAVVGRSVRMESSTLRIDLRPGVPVARAEMSWRQRLIQFVSSPEIAYLLLSGGMMAIFFEIVTPGGFVLGTAGALMLLLGSIGLKMLPFSWAGMALLGAGLLVMVIDLFVGGVGILTLLGLPVFCLGGLFLFQAPGGELLRMSLSVVLGTGLGLGICFLLFAFLVVKGLRRRVSTGRQGMVGLEAEALSVVGGDAEPGQVRCHGELWRARSQGAPIPAGGLGVVTAVEGLTLVLRPLNGE